MIHCLRCLICYPGQTGISEGTGSKGGRSIGSRLRSRRSKGRSVMSCEWIRWLPAVLRLSLALLPSACCLSREGSNI